MRVSKDPEIRKQEIIDVAMQVFAEKGYETTTMKDIAKAADVAVSYTHLILDIVLDHRNEKKVMERKF